MRASVNFSLLSGISSSSLSSSFDGLGFGLIDFGSMGNSHSGNSIVAFDSPGGRGSGIGLGDARSHQQHCPAEQAETVQCHFLLHAHVAILVSMSRISRRALPVATVTLARFLIGKRLVHRTRGGPNRRPHRRDRGLSARRPHRLRAPRANYQQCAVVCRAWHGLRAHGLRRLPDTEPGVRAGRGGGGGADPRARAHGGHRADAREPARIHDSGTWRAGQDECARRSASAVSLSGVDLCSSPVLWLERMPGAAAGHPGDDAYWPVARSASSTALHRARQPFRERSAIMRAMRDRLGWLMWALVSAAALAADSRRSPKPTFAPSLGAADDRAPVLSRPRLPAADLRRVLAKPWARPGVNSDVERAIDGRRSR